jgi:hypothetical protein
MKTNIWTRACPKCHGAGWIEWAHGVNGNCTECHGFGVVSVEHSPAAADDLVIVTGDALPDEVAAILALTPHVDETADWATREAEAAAVSAAGADGLAASWGFFVEKRIQYEPDGDVLWAA